MIAPEVPTGGLVGQAVFNHQSDRQRHHAVRVVAFWQGHVRHVRVKIDVTLGAMMNGVRQMDVVWTARDQVPHVVQYARDAAMSIGTVFASGTRLPPEIPTAFDDLRLGQVLTRVMPSVASGKYSPGPGMAQPSLAMLGKPGNYPNFAAVSSSKPNNVARVSKTKPFLQEVHLWRHTVSQSSDRLCRSSQIVGRAGFSRCRWT